MWPWIASRVLRNRITILVVVALITLFMGWKAQFIQMSYKHGGLLPKNDSAYIDYEDFLHRFSEDGNVMVLGLQGPQLYTPVNFKAWYDLGNDLRDIDGVDSVFSEAHLFDLVRDDSLKRFRLVPMMTAPPTTQPEMDSLRTRILGLPFYRGLLYNDSTDASLMMVFINTQKFNSEARGDMMQQVLDRGTEFEKTGMEMHYSGLPYIRVMGMDLVKAEMPWFLALSLLVSAVLLLLFFRSWRVMTICMGVVGIAVIWSFGTIALLDYRITLLMSVIPPLVIVTGVPNCVFLINNYHHEFVRHGNKMLALNRMISRVGSAAFMTNATKAAGFSTFMVTYSDVLKEFGLVATVGILSLWALSMVLIPIMFSFMPAPKPRHTKHLKSRWLDKTVERIVRLTTTRRPVIYITTTAVFLVALYGMFLLRDESRIVDDLPRDHPVLTHLNFFERNFRGVMPLEVVIDTRKKGGALKDGTLKRIQRLEDTLGTYVEFSKPLSVVSAVKFTKQAFYGGDPAKYDLIKGPEKTFILPYLEGANQKQDVGKAFLDTARQTTRLTVQMADIGTTRMDALMKKLEPQVDSIFDPATYHVTLTGTSMVFLKGSAYLVSNLAVSLFWAVVIIVGLMALLFNSLRILVVSLIPNIIPLVLTAGLMGYFDVPIKPSTILVFSIALGIAVDNAIYLLARYRLELKLTGHDIHRSIDRATREVSVGIIYTSMVLFFGFIVLGASQFGGIQALGILTSVTLAVAMFTNLLVLPALLHTFERSVTTKAFEEPLVEIVDEEDAEALGPIKTERPDAST